MAAQESENTVGLCLNILRRMPPKDIDNDLVRVLCLADQKFEDEICQRVDLPLKVSYDEKVGKNFIVCDYNRDGDSHRSPWTNEFHPPMKQGLKPDLMLRSLEEMANKLFDVYRHFYFEGGTSSVYMWNLGSKNDFAAAFLITKDLTGENKGSWNSIHVIEAIQKNHSSFAYKLTSTILVDINTQESNKAGQLNLSGTTSKQTNKTCAWDSKDSAQSHMLNMGPLIEETELDLRNSIEGTYFGKAVEVFNGIRISDVEVEQNRKKLAKIALSAAN